MATRREKGLKTPDCLERMKVVILMLKMLVCVPLDQKKTFYNKFKDMVLKAADGELKSKLSAFFTYFSKKWINNSFLNFCEISNQERIIRTNNNCEAFHSAFAKVVQVRKPRASYLIKKLQGIEMSYRSYFVNREKNPHFCAPESLPGITRSELLLQFSPFYKKIDKNKGLIDPDDILNNEELLEMLKEMENQCLRFFDEQDLADDADQTTAQGNEEQKAGDDIDSQNNRISSVEIGPSLNDDINDNIFDERLYPPLQKPEAIALTRESPKTDVDSPHNRFVNKKISTSEKNAETKDLKSSTPTFIPYQIDTDALKLHMSNYINTYLSGLVSALTTSSGTNNHTDAKTTKPIEENKADPRTLYTNIRPKGAEENSLKRRPALPSAEQENELMTDENLDNEAKEAKKQSKKRRGKKKK
jgi:hypothetical protein